MFEHGQGSQPLGISAEYDPGPLSDGKGRALSVGITIRVDVGAVKAGAVEGGIEGLEDAADGANKVEIDDGSPGDAFCVEGGRAVHELKFWMTNVSGHIDPAEKQS